MGKARYGIEQQEHLAPSDPEVFSNCQAGLRRPPSGQGRLV
jgi:hypothetical protein